MKTESGSSRILRLILTSKPDGGEWRASGPGFFTPVKVAVSLEQEAVWASKSVRTVLEK
jgi:hypothetical protein